MSRCIASTAIFSIFVGVTAADAQRRNEVAVGLQQRGYMEPQYAAATIESDYLFVGGDGVPFRLQLNNVSEATVVLQPPSGRLDGLVQLGLYRKESGTWHQVQAAVSYSADITNMGRSSSFVSPWRAPFELPSATMLSVDGTVRIAEPGVYELRVQSLSGSCTPACTLVNSTGLLRFEIRNPNSIAEQLEVLTRSARSATLDSRYEEADQFLAEMLRLHPSSVVARLLAGDNNERRGALSTAEADYRIGVSLIRSGRDTLFIRGKTSDELARLAASVDRKIDRLAVRRPR